MARLNDYSMIVNPGDCDICGRKDQPGIEIYRNAKRHEREHFVVQICEHCVLELRSTLQLPQKEVA